MNEAYESQKNEAIIQRDKSIKVVRNFNEKNHPGWSKLAYTFLEIYAKNHEVFWPFEVTDSFLSRGLVPPTTGKAWGSVYRAALRNGLIEPHSELRQHPQRHATRVLGWRSNIYNRLINT